MNGKNAFLNEQLAKWLRLLVYVAIVSFVNSIVNMLPFIPASVTTWVSRGIMAAVVVCMFYLAPASERYKKSGILRLIILACTMITSLVYPSGILNIMASVVSIFAVYQEYSGHAEMTADLDPRLSGKWHTLFNWSILAGVLVGLGSTAAAVILSMLEMDAVSLTSLIVVLLFIPQLILDVVYMLYLKKMTSILTDGNDKAEIREGEKE